MIFDFKDYRLYGELKPKSRFSRIETTQWPMSVIVPCKCSHCDAKAEYYGVVDEEEEQVVLCFDHMIKELDLKPNADDLIKKLRK